MGKKMLTDELMDEVIEEMEGGGGVIEHFCKLFDQREIDVVIGRLEKLLAFQISDYEKAETVRSMIKRLKTVPQVRPAALTLNAARLDQ